MNRQLLDEYRKKGFLIPTQKLIKSPQQIEGIRQSCQLTKKILDMLTDRIEEGVTTNQINRWVHDFTIQHGGIPAPLNYHGFPRSVCTSVNHVICHGIPNDTPLKNGDIVNVDVTTILHGFYGDASRIYPVGDIADRARKLVDVARECLYLGIEQVQPYHSLNAIGDVIERHAIKHGYSVVRDYCGHGVGLKFHEEPKVAHYIQRKKGVLLLPDMVFTVEPMINEGRYECKVLPDKWTAVTIDGLLSAQWEHTVRVTKTGVEILTA